MTKKMRIELIEDDVLLAQQFCRTLERAGYDVHHSLHGLAAIAAIDYVIPDVIVLDLLLPATTGFALLHELQSYDDTRVIPVVLCSGVVPTLDEVAPYGVKRIIDKTTMHPSDLVSAVRAVLP